MGFHTQAPRSCGGGGHDLAAPWPHVLNLFFFVLLRAGLTCAGLTCGAIIVIHILLLLLLVKTGTAEAAAFTAVAPQSNSPRLPEKRVKR